MPTPTPPPPPTTNWLTIQQTRRADYVQRFAIFEPAGPCTGTANAQAAPARLERFHRQ